MTRHLLVRSLSGILAITLTMVFAGLAGAQAIDTTAEGPLAGTMATPNGAMPWTAARLKVRPAPIAGPWTMRVRLGDSVMTMALVFKQDGRNVAGTLTSDHTGTLAIAGAYVDGVLTFSTDSGTGGDASHVNYSARMKFDGTLSGEINGPMGQFSWTAERVKK